MALKKIPERELVDVIGSEKMRQKESLSSTERSRLIAKAKSIYGEKNVEVLPDHYYKIRGFDDINKLTPSLIKSTKGLYKYLCPLILSYFGDKAPLRNHIYVGNMTVARHINMVNQYYDIVKENQSDVCDILEPKYSKMLTGGVSLQSDQINLMWDYFDKCDNMISYYIERSLKYLRSMLLIDYIDSFLVVRYDGFDISDDVAVVNRVTSPATEEEVEFYIKACEQADDIAQCHCEKDRYYSAKANKWHEALHSILKEKGITAVYRIYEVFSVHKDRIDTFNKVMNTNYKKINSDLEAEMTQLIAEAVAKKNMNVNAETVKMYCNLLSEICIGDVNSGKKKLLEKIENVDKRKNLVMDVQSEWRNKYNAK